MNGWGPDPRLAGKEWGWRRFGHRFGISILLTRARWMGLRPRLFHDGPRVFVLHVNFGCGQLWLRVPVGPIPKAARAQRESLRRLK